MAETGKRALITGGAGFIGSHLCDRLRAQGWAVTVLDDLSTGRVENIRAHEGRPSFTFYVGSADDPQLLRELVAATDVVFHLAAVVGVRKVMENTVETIERNLHATESVLKTCNLFRKRLLIASTSEVYGANPKAAFTEEDCAIIGNSRHRRWCYAAGKLLDEFHAYAYYYATALPVTTVRLFNTVGPRQVGHYGMVVPTFVRQALAGEPLTVYGDGSQKRCFTYVGDTVEALYRLAEKPETAGEIYNIGADAETSIQELAETIKRLTGSASPIVRKSYAEVFGEDFVDMERRRPDTSKLRAAIGFAPTTPLAETLGKIIAHMQGK